MRYDAFQPQRCHSRTPEHTALGWEVRDIRARITELSNKDITFERYPHFQQDDLGVWTAPSGAHIAWFRDPDGNVLSLTQP